jgi:non-canonical purine NTP pyrophosphatase (RdgB/HAM1 family)/lipoate-protein ligase B
MNVLIATRNAHKLAEIRAILAMPGVNPVGLDAVGLLPEVVEDRDTFAGNAIKKARETAAAAGCWAMADDSGLEVDALDGAPGVYSARYAGEPASTEANNRKLLEAMKGRTDRRARFRCAMALVRPGGDAYCVEGCCEGTILEAERGTGGFGYDPLFRPEGRERSFAEMPAEEKNRLSHRAAALRAAAEAWAPILESAADGAAWTPSRGPRLDVIDLGRMAYGPALRLQASMAAARRAGTAEDTLLLVEHEPVYTLGRQADEAHLLWSEAQRARRGIEVHHAGRGGDVTYHGPGQVVGYPILALGPRSRHAAWYVGVLEQVLVRTLARFGVAARGDARNRGVWIGAEKIGAIGVRIARGVTMHGFALNVAVDLSFFEGIVPCGIRGKGVTSLDRLVPGITPGQVKPVLVEAFRQVLCEAMT